MPKIDAVVIDEAQKLSDGSRGVLLQDVIDRSIFECGVKKVIFISPFTSNPENLLSDAPAKSRKETLISKDRMVSQNIFWLSQAPRKPKLWDIYSWRDNEQLSVGQLALEHAPSTDKKKMALMAYSIGGNNPGNIVYVNRPSDAETVAGLIHGQVTSFVITKDIRDLIDLVKETIHPDFALARTLEKGVAFHYGNMPHLVRMEIERLFAEGQIIYLVCTSTLVEGVNMSCKNIFIRNPQRGSNKKMTQEDFWNLAGRAGRWGKEFQGNIFCIDANVPDLWLNGEPPKVRKSVPIERVTDQVISRAKTFTDFVDSGALLTGIQQNPDFEYVLSYLVAQQKRFGSIKNTAWAAKFDAEEIAALELSIQKFSARLKVPLSATLRNPGINPIWIDDLYAYFKTKEHEADDLLPADPSSNDAAANYGKVFSRIFNSLRGSLLGPAGPRAFVLGMLVTRWMKGFPLARLISERVKYQKTKANFNLAATIRETMKDVEEVARFAAPKYLNCYNDVLRIFLKDIGRDDLLSELTDLSLLLEFGVSSQTQISLMALGLSRTTTIALSGHIINDKLSEKEVLLWLTKENYEQLPVPNLVKREIEMVLKVHQPSQ